jgi:tRNA(Ile)-lysidine synthase
MIEETFKKTIEKYGLLERKDKLLLGVSGGPDSIFMLQQFVRMQREYKLYLVCAHFNHSLRVEADEEEDFVKKVCRDVGIKCVSEKKAVLKFFKGDSLEQTARNMRFDFFQKCANEFKIKKIALAHHKDDVVETTLMRIIRGTALRGLRGILPQSKLRGLTVIRPLIELRKKEILEWLHHNKVAYRLDKTNLEDKFFRNKIRLTLLPILEEFNPNIVNAVYHLCRLTSLDYECIYNLAKERYNRLKKQKGRHYVKLDINELKKLDSAIIFNVLRFAIEELKGDTRKLDLRHFEEMVDLLYHRPFLSIVDLPDLEVKKEENWLTIKNLLF